MKTMTEQRATFTRSEAFLVSQLEIGRDNEVVRNPFSGESIELNPMEVALHDYCKGCEMVSDWRGLEQGLDLFRKINGKAYMVLMD